MTFIFGSVGLNMQVLTLATFSSFMAKPSFAADRYTRGSVPMVVQEQARDSLSTPIIPRRRKVLGKDK